MILEPALTVVYVHTGIPTRAIPSPLLPSPRESPPTSGSYLEVFLIQDLLPPLDQEGSADVQVEMGESFWL